MQSEHTFSFATVKKTSPKVLRTVPESSRPIGYGESTTVAYYNKECALAVKAKIDQLDPDLKDSIIYFPVPKYKNPRTVYEQVYYGFRYLIERLDTPDRKYLRLRKELTIKKERSRIRISWRKAGLIHTLEGGEIVHIESNKEVLDNRLLSWQDRIIRWVAEGADPSVEEARIDLDEDEMSWIREYLGGFENNIVIIRLNPVGYKITKNTKLVEAMRR